MTIDWPALEAANAPLNAFIDFDRSAALGPGPLAGLTVGVKSNLAVKGLPWTAGMALRRDVIADRDAAVVAALRAAGAAILGTVNMHEAALGATTDNPWFGRTHNPHRIGLTPGGSSGGSGAAAAAGLCDAALGTDTLGSVRIPASYCGVYGLKPTHGAVDEDGLVHLGRRFDVIGPLARDLDVLERVWRVIGRPGDAAPFARAMTLDRLAGVALQPGVRAGYDRALAALALPLAAPLALPTSVTAIRLAALAETARELKADLADALQNTPELISPEVTGLMNALAGLPTNPALLTRVRDAVVAALGDDAVLLTPATPQAAFAHGLQVPGSQADFTALANVAGLPALACPAGRDADGLPVGVQLLGPAGSEDRLTALARRLEPALGGALSVQGAGP